jgi:hypothetical protein
MNLERPIIPDNPKKSIDEIDSSTSQLEYGQFIETIYNYISTYSGKDSICIGLEGSWGSGKSTIINLINSQILKTEEHQSIVFNPWYITDTDNIVSQFFAHVASRLHKVSKYKSISRCFKMLADAAVVIGSTVSLTYPKLGAAITVSRLALSFWATYAKKDEKDIWKVKEKLSKALDKLERPIVILIDDLDRLHKAEIRSMLTAIRAVGNLPNVIYILAYDREIVASALDNDGSNGTKYLEKIIQVKMSVPVINEIDRFNYVMDDITTRQIISAEEVDAYRNVLAFIIDCIPTIRLANQLLNRFHYRLLYQMGQLCTFDLFLISIIEVLAPPIVDLITSNPPIDEPESPISWRLLSSRQRKVSYANDVIKHCGLTSNDLTTPVPFPLDTSAKITFASRIYNLPARYIREFRVITFVSKLLFDLDDIEGFDDGLVGKPDFHTGNLKHRLREDSYFHYYFKYANERGCSPQQYKSYMQSLRAGERAFGKDEESAFRTLFINKCSYEFEPSDLNAYIFLLVQVTSDKIRRASTQTYEAIKALIFNCIANENDAIKLFNALINENTKAIYLTFLYQLSASEYSPSLQFRMQKIADMFRLKLEDQIGKNVVEQIQELPNSLYPSSVVEFLIEHKDNKEVDDCLRQITSDNAFYLSFLVAQLRKDEAGKYRIASVERLPFFNNEELAHRLPIIQRTDDYRNLDDDTKHAIEDILNDAQSSITG